jgi:hypothetical protein
MSQSKYVPLTKPLYTSDELVARMAEIQDVAIVLSPFSGVSDIQPGWRVSERHVFADLEGGDIYKPFWGKGDDVAPSGKLLNRIWNAAGGSVLYLRRVDDRQDPHIVEWEGILELRQIDTNVVKIPCEKRLDLSKGSAAIEKMKPGQIGQARGRIHELGATEAFFRGVRKGTGMSQSYSEAVLKVKPFVVYCAVPDYDMQDPVIKRMVVASQLGVTNLMYGPAAAGPALETAPAPRALPPGTTEIVEAETITDASDFAPPPAEEEEKEEEVKVCECPCGDQIAISEEVAEATTRQVGAPRCRECYPAKSFVYDRHKDLSSLKLPLAPKLTPSMAHSNAQKMRGEV